MSQYSHQVRQDEARRERPGAQNGDRSSDGRENPTDRTIRAAVVILGVAGAAGQGVLRAAVGRRRRVVAVGADRAELAALRARYPHADIAIHAAAIESDADVARLAARLRREGPPVEGVVDAMPAGPGRGRLIDRPTSALRATLEADLLPHLAAARHLIPLVAETTHGGGYVLIGGPGSEASWLNYGGRSVAAAALRMLARVLHDEAQPLDVRVQILLPEAPIRGEACGAQCEHWPSGDEVGEQALRLLERDGAPAAHPIVYVGRRVDSAAHRTTSVKQGFTDVPSFLKTLTSADPTEVFRDDIA
jgi:NAD(P)-dependent dehydrogenase (short-subunit alcohol dehydrogenase family)